MARPLFCAAALACLPLARPMPQEVPLALQRPLQREQHSLCDGSHGAMHSTTRRTIVTELLRPQVVAEPLQRDLALQARQRFGDAVRRTAHSFLFEDCSYEYVAYCMAR